MTDYRVVYYPAPATVWDSSRAYPRDQTGTVFTDEYRKTRAEQVLESYRRSAPANSNRYRIEEVP